MSHPHKDIQDQGTEFASANAGELNHPRRRLYVLARMAIFAVVLLVLVFGVRFVLFAVHVADIKPPADPKADAIVVLTGGTERIKQALELLSQGRAKRLLISGVHPGTSQKQIAASTEVDEELFECCVDLDRIAMNTIGNAYETSDWVSRFGFRSLLVVTSAYHLPRASLELRAALPHLDLIAYPVISKNLDLRSWYLKPTTIHLLLREYVKYTLAQLRLGTMGPTATR